MRPSTLLRILSSFHLPARLSSSPVVPMPLQSSFDRWLSSEIHPLRCHGLKPSSYTSAGWILNALDVALSTQKKTIESLPNVFCGEEDRKVMEDYIEAVVELLDACNRLRERMETVKNYIESLRVVLHCFQGRTEPNESVLVRARAVLDSCEAMEKRCAELEKCSSGLRKLGDRLALAEGTSSRTSETELHEVLSGSMAVALLVCGMLGIALSFKSKRGLPATQTRETSSWSTSLHELHKEVKEEMDKRRKSGDTVLTELRETVVAARNLRDLMKNKVQQQSELRVNVKALGKSCGELEKGMKPLEGRVNELYRHLLSIRMVLLNILSQL